MMMSRDERLLQTSYATKNIAGLDGNCKYYSSCYTTKMIICATRTVLLEEKRRLMNGNRFISVGKSISLLNLSESLTIYGKPISFITTCNA